MGAGRGSAGQGAGWARPAILELALVVNVTERVGCNASTGAVSGRGHGAGLPSASLTVLFNRLGV